MSQDRMTAAELLAFQRGTGKVAATDGPNAPARAKRQDREGPIHRAIIELLDYELPPDAIYHHSPNELDMSGPEAARQIAKARGLGTRIGWTDLEIIWQGRFYGVEIKAPGGRVSTPQSETHAAMRRAGALVAVVSSVSEMKEILIQWDIL